MIQTNPSVRLDELIPSGQVCQGDPRVSITGLSIDSRNVVSGDLFFAIPGKRKNGVDFVADAVQAGAVAIAIEGSDSDISRQISDKVSVVNVKRLAAEASAIAGKFYGEPSEHMRVTAVTGTNGKTSFCFWYAWLSNRLGVSCGQIGTLGAGRVTVQTTGLTTPDAVSVQRHLAEVRDEGAEAVVMEVSSHGLDQGRVSGVEFDTAVFTNLTHDHLDYHGTMENYFQAKAKLFTRSGLRRVVLNKDESVYTRLKDLVSHDTELLSYAIDDDTADLYLREVEWVGSGARIQIAGKWGDSEVVVPVIGRYTLSNILAVTTALLAQGFSLQSIVTELADLPPVPGRMQMLTRAGLPKVVIDYAHTPDALESVLSALRPLVKGKLVCVIGCGGDRDSSKRAVMGALASSLADQSWFTSDNPRSENPEQIISDMCVDIGSANVRREASRTIAIKQAILGASEDDLVAVLGKGHEEFQEIGGVKYPYSDISYSNKILDTLVDQTLPPELLSKRSADR